AAAADVVQLEDLRDLDHAAREDAHEERGERDEEDRLHSDEAVRLGGRVEDRGELVHQRDDADREPREVPLAALGEAEEARALQHDGEAHQEEEVQPEEDDRRHASPRTSNSCSRDATPVAAAPSAGPSPRAFPAGRTQRRNPCRPASRSRAAARPTARTSPVSPTSPHTTTSAASARPRAEEATAATTARSAAGSSMRSPPATFRNTSWS